MPTLIPTPKIWMNGTLVDWDKAQVHVLTHTLHYGTGVFEGIRAYETADGPAVFRLQEHIERLFPDTRKAYTTYIARTFALANQPDAEGAAARITSLETRIAQAQWDRAKNRDRNATYNKTGLAALQATTPHFDWQAYLGSLPAGAKDKVSELIVRQPDYLKAIDAIVAETPIETWKEYLKFALISEYANGLSTPFADSQFEFTGKVLAGRQQQPPRWKRGVNEVEQTLGEPVGREYVARHFKPEAKARMDALIRNLLAAFHEGIDELEIGRAHV